MKNTIAKVITSTHLAFLVQRCHRWCIKSMIRCRRLRVDRSHACGDKWRLAQMQFDGFVLQYWPDLDLFEGLVSTRVAGFTYVDILVSKTLQLQTRVNILTISIFKNRFDHEYDKNYNTSIQIPTFCHSAKRQPCLMNSNTDSVIHLYMLRFRHYSLIILNDHKSPKQSDRFNSFLKSSPVDIWHSNSERFYFFQTTEIHGLHLQRADANLTFWFKSNVDRTMHSKFDPTRVRSHDVWIMN